MRVLLAARSPAAANGAAAALRKQGMDNVYGCTLDVRNQRDIARFAERHDQIDILINNAAVCPPGWSRQATLNCWRTNVLGPLTLTQRLLPSMLKRGRGHIVHISSGDGELLYLQTELQAALREAESERDVLRLLASAAPPRNAYGAWPAHGPTPAYAVSKAAVNAIARITAAQMPQTCRVRVSAICPGDVATRMLSAHDPEAVRGALPPSKAARDVWRVATDGLLSPEVLPNGRFWRHARQIDF